MLKCTDNQFTQTSPSAFFRRSKRPYTVNDEDRQIQDSDISQKLQLILISLREQSTKETQYFSYKTKQLESQVNEQNNIISILQAENKLLRSHVELYVKKYGGLGKCLGEKRSKTIESDVEIEDQQEQHDKQMSNNECCYLKVDDVKSKVLSSKSTHYKSSFIKSSQGQSARQQKKSHPSSYINNNSSEDCKSLAGSSSSNFYKKKVPFHHRRQSSLQREESKQVNILPVMSQFNNNKSKQFQLSEISCRVARKDTFVDRLREEEESSKESEDQQASRIQEVDCLGLQSKGSGFFRQHHRYDQNLDDEETLLIQNYESQYDGCCEESIVRYVESIDETQQQNELTFDSTKTDSDIRKMGEALEAKFGSQSKQLEQDCEVSPCENTASQQLNLKELHHSYFKTLDIFQKRNQQSNNYHQISGEKRLKALFSPLPQNLLSKKINLPSTAKNASPTNKGYFKESRNVKGIVEHFSEFDQKKLLMREVENPLEMAVKRLKEGSKFCGMR